MKELIKQVILEYLQGDDSLAGAWKRNLPAHAVETLSGDVADLVVGLLGPALEEALHPPEPEPAPEIKSAVPVVIHPEDHLGPAPEVHPDPTLVVG